MPVTGMSKRLTEIRADYLVARVSFLGNVKVPIPVFLVCFHVYTVINKLSMDN